MEPHIQATMDIQNKTQLLTTLRTHKDGTSQGLEGITRASTPNTLLFTQPRLASTRATSLVRGLEEALESQLEEYQILLPSLRNSLRQRERLLLLKPIAYHLYQMCSLRKKLKKLSKKNGRRTSRNISQTTMRISQPQMRLTTNKRIKTPSHLFLSKEALYRASKK